MLQDLLKPFRYPKPAWQAPLPRGRERRARTSDIGGTLKQLAQVLSPHKYRLLLVMTMVVLSSGLALIGPVLVGNVVDRVLIGGDTKALGVLIAGLAAVYAGHSLTMWLQNFTMIRIAQQTVYTMRKRLFRHLHAIPLAFFDRRQHGELMSRATNDMENVSSTLNSSVIQIFSSVLTLTGTISVMLWLSPALTAVTLTVVPALFFGMKWITARTGRLFKLQQNHLGELNGIIQETLSGQRIVKMFSREQRVIAKFREKNDRLKNSGFWAQTYSGFIPKLMNLLNNASYALIAAVGGWLAVRGLVSVGTIVIFVEYSRQFTRPLNDLANQWNTLLSAIAGAERVFEVLREPEETRDEVALKELAHVRGEVEFERVRFAYEKGGDTIRDISFRAAPGQTVALVGPTGAGKSTVIQLLARFYTPDGGRILVDGVDIAEVTRESLRRHMAFVLQDPFLFQGTIRDNIRYGRLDATDEEVEEAARMANAHSFIVKLPDGYDTWLNADGGGISQGQKQLLSIARAMLADPAIFILDEATSNIDTVTEIKIQEALRRLMQGRTSFVIAHRLNTIRSADLILVLRDGTVAEQGTHSELMAKNGFYRELYTSGQT